MAGDTGERKNEEGRMKNLKTWTKPGKSGPDGPINRQGAKDAKTKPETKSKAEISEARGARLGARGKRSKTEMKATTDCADGLWKPAKSDPSQSA